MVLFLKVIQDGLKSNDNYFEYSLIKSKLMDLVSGKPIYPQTEDLRRETKAKIPAVYKKGARASHFRGVHDITLITKMVWKSLHTRWFFLSGLYHSSIRPRDITKLNKK